MHYFNQHRNAHFGDNFVHPLITVGHVGMTPNILTSGTNPFKQYQCEFPQSPKINISLQQQQGGQAKQDVLEPHES
jgi:hypothetical protein